jgi:hypothetical protein
MEKQDFEVQLAKTTEAKNNNEASLLSLSKVQAVGIGFKEVKGKITKDMSVNIYVEEKLPKTKVDKADLIPESLTLPDTGEKVITDVIEIGVVEALSYTARIRPAKPGYSIGHYKITAGTLGCLVRDSCYPCRVRILSNNHVLANSNSASTGDPILQPGPYDGGTYPGDLIARLERFVPIRFGNINLYNLVDAALATPVDQRDVVASVVGLGIPKGTEEATLGMDVVKSGRTTQTTAGKVTAVDVTVAVGYGSSGVAYFRNQIMTSNMSQGGDSGSLLLSRAERNAVGLLFAGSNTVTIHNNISNVMMALGVEMIVA